MTAGKSGRHDAQTENVNDLPCRLFFEHKREAAPWSTYLYVSTGAVTESDS